MEPVEDPSWKTYSEAVLEFSNELTVDLQQELDEATRQALATLPIGFPFAVVSAANPKGQENNQAFNDQSFSALRTEVARRGFPCMEVTGVSGDGQHRERALAVELSIVEAHRLAHDAEQSAYFWYDGTAFWLVGARVDSQGLKLPDRTNRFQAVHNR